MRALSIWARDHKWSSRLLIIFVLYPLLNLTAFVLGDVLSSINIQLGPGWYYVFILLAIAIFLIYPSTKSSYAGRKLMHCMMAFCTFCLVGVFGNRLDKTPVMAFAANEASAATPVSEKPAKLRKEVKKSIKKFIHEVRKKYRGDQGTKAALIILTVLLAIGVFLLLGALACSIACNGAEVLAFIILIAGGIGIFVAMGAIIGNIKRKYPREPKETPVKAS